MGSHCDASHDRSGLGDDQMKIRGLKGFKPSNQSAPQGFDGETVCIGQRPEAIESLEDLRLLYLYEPCAASKQKTPRP
jgi:hypothetical protein